MQITGALSNFYHSDSSELKTTDGTCNYIPKNMKKPRKQCEKRAEWKKITEKGKTHSGL